MSREIIRNLFVPNIPSFMQSLDNCQEFLSRLCIKHTNVFFSATHKSHVEWWENIEWMRRKLSFANSIA